MRAKIPHQKSRKRVGRGHGSGHGKTSCKGHKGQNARGGVSFRADFEGGQTPLFRRVPKRGFNRPRVDVSIVNLDQLASLDVAEVTPELLLQKGLISRIGAGVKVLGRGTLTKKMSVKAHRFSTQAKAAIEQAGGTAVLIEKKMSQTSNAESTR